MRQRRWARRASAAVLGAGCLVLGVAGLAGPAGAQVTGITPPPTGGFFNAKGAPIDSAFAGDAVSLVVGVSQAQSVTSTGTVVLRWNAKDFGLVGTDTGCNATTTAGTATLSCSYSNLTSSSTFVYQFTALVPDPNAAITVTAQANGTPLSETFPLNIEAAPLTIVPPPPNGKGGWYGANGSTPVTSAQTGTPVSLLVTALQPGAVYPNGTIALQWPTADFSYAGTSDTTAACSSATSGSTTTLTCDYNDLAHASTSETFHFVTGAVDPKASVGVTATVDTYTASQAFPLAITSTPSTPSAPSTPTTPTTPTSPSQCRNGAWQHLTNGAGHSFRSQRACVRYAAHHRQHGVDRDDQGRGNRGNHGNRGHHGNHGNRGHRGDGLRGGHHGQRSGHDH